LLTLPDLARQIESVVSQRKQARIALVVGGGPAVDLVREWDRSHALGEEISHELAIRAMRLNADFVARLLPNTSIVENEAALAAAWSSHALPLLAADAWLSRAECDGRSTVPHTWDATSDSIAAWFATELQAAELVLLKSVDRPAGDANSAARDGLVDPCFPAAAAQIPQVSWVNLRSADCRIDPWISYRSSEEQCDGEHGS
jgi:aspartokinase-like uncharacterized kinase